MQKIELTLVGGMIVGFCFAVVMLVASLPSISEVGGNTAVRLSHLMPFSSPDQPVVVNRYRGSVYARPAGSRAMSSADVEAAPANRPQPAADESPAN